jgi:F-type H+-transporting ATPase subunit delta
MSSTKIAKRYASALYLNAESGKQQQLLAELQQVESTLNSNQNLQDLLANASVDSSEKSKVLQQVFSQNSSLIKNLLLLLCEKRRENLLNEVITSFYTTYNQFNKIENVTVYSAMPLDRTSQDTISKIVKEKTGANEIVLTNKIDKSLLGGFVIRFGDYLLDTSIQSNLTKIKKEFKLA